MNDKLILFLLFPLIALNIGVGGDVVVETEADTTTITTPTDEDSKNDNQMSSLKDDVIVEIPAIDYLQPPRISTNKEEQHQWTKYNQRDSFEMEQEDDDDNDEDAKLISPRPQIPPYRPYYYYGDRPKNISPPLGRKIIGPGKWFPPYHEKDSSPPRQRHVGKPENVRLYGRPIIGPGKWFPPYYAERRIGGTMKRYGVEEDTLPASETSIYGVGGYNSYYRNLRQRYPNLPLLYPCPWLKSCYTRGRDYQYKVDNAYDYGPGPTLPPIWVK